MSNGKTVTVDSLIDEGEAMIPLAYQIQNDEGLNEQERGDRLASLEVKYLTWYRAGLALFADKGRLDAQALFMVLYDGRFPLVIGTKQFLRSGLKSALFGPDKKYAVSHEAFTGAIRDQCNLLSALGTA